MPDGRIRFNQLVNRPRLLGVRVVLIIQQGGGSAVLLRRLSHQLMINMPTYSQRRNQNVVRRQVVETARDLLAQRFFIRVDIAKDLLV